MPEVLKVQMYFASRSALRRALNERTSARSTYRMRRIGRTVRLLRARRGADAADEAVRSEMRWPVKVRGAHS
jgi:hypothetical protein